MPTYTYRCSLCGREVELVQKMSEKVAPACVEDGCGGQQMETVIVGTAFVLKGSGWSRDGYSTKRGK